MIDREIREEIIALAQDAAAAILGIYDSEFAVEHKDDDSPLTAADLAAHRVHWPLGTLQLEAVTACCSDEAFTHLEGIRRGLAADREAMCEALDTAGIEVAGEGAVIEL